MKNRIPIIIDTDPGIDDAFALLYAMANPHFEIKLITSTSGNVSIENTTTNLQKIAAFSKEVIPLAKGADRPLIRDTLYAKHVHGEDGLCGVNLDLLPRPLLKKHAVEAMRDILLEAHEPITIISLGPMTNLALLIRMYPHVIPFIKKIAFMGGGLKGGNVTTTAEFNIYADPEAAHIVFNSGIKLIMAGLDVTEKSHIDVTNIYELNNHNAHTTFLYTLIMTFKKGHLEEDYTRNLHDVVPLMYLIHPEYFTETTTSIFVAIEHTETYGLTYAENRTHSQTTPNAVVLMDVDVDKFRAHLLETLNDGLI